MNKRNVEMGETNYGGRSILKNNMNARRNQKTITIHHTDVHNYKTTFHFFIFITNFIKYRVHLSFIKKN